MSSPTTGGLYDPAFEHDACGVAFVADLAGGRSHDVVANALTALRNLEHRGATGREIDTGDGAGLLTQIPDAFFRGVVDFPLPALGAYAVGIAFLPVDNFAAGSAVAGIERIVADEDLRLLGWREVPVVPRYSWSERTRHDAALPAGVRCCNDPTPDRHDA